MNLLVCSSLEFGTTSKRDRIALDSGAFVRMVTVDVHVPEGWLWRKMLLSVWSYPEGLSMNTVQTAAGHDQSLFCRYKINAINKDTTQHIER